MGPLSSMFQANSGAAQPSASGLGGWFAGASALQAISQVGQGFAQMNAGKAEAAAQNQQANLALQQSTLEAERTAREGRQFGANQAEGYLGSGVTLQGTPAQVLEQTRSLAQQEVNAIKQRGALTTQLLRTQAMRTQQAGRNALLGGVANAGLGMMQNYFQGVGRFQGAVPKGSYYNPVGQLGPQPIPTTAAQLPWQWGNPNPGSEVWGSNG